MMRENAHFCNQSCTKPSSSVTRRWQQITGSTHVICVDITQRDILQTCFSKYFHCLAIFTGVPAYFHLVGITGGKEQNLHHLESAAGADILFCIQAHKW